MSSLHPTARHAAAALAVACAPAWAAYLAGLVGTDGLGEVWLRKLACHHKPQAYGSQGTLKDGRFVLDEVRDPEQLVEKAYRPPASAN